MKRIFTLFFAVLLFCTVGSSTNVKADAVAPIVIAVDRQYPSVSFTNANSVTFRVTFSENVSGVDVSDFSVTATGASAGTITTVSASSGTWFDVTINSITGDGTLQLDVNGSGTGIIDDAGNALSGGYTTDNTYTIDQTVPTVSSVGMPANARYTSGQNINLVINFDEAVNIVTSGGIPYIPITLNSGGTVSAIYISGSGSTALTFGYTVVGGNCDEDGINIGSSITANGGTIKDATGNDAILALNGVAGTAGVLVDAVITPSQSGSLVFSDVEGTTMTIGWTNGNGSKRVLFVKASNTGKTSPVKNSSYTANSVFGSGTQITSGWYCVYNGSGSSVTVTGLSMGVDYIAEVFEYNGPLGYEKYNLTTSAGNPKTQATLSCANPTNGGTIATDQAGCISLDASALTNVTSPINYTGTLEYKWQKSTISGSAGFTDMDSSDFASYNPGVITETTWYKRLARTICMNTWSGASESNVVMLTVYPATFGGSITAENSTITYGDATGNLTLVGYVGSVVKWQKRLGSGDWSDTNTTGATYNETPTSTGVFQYRALVKSGSCSESYSSLISIVVAPKPLTVTAENKTMIYNGTAYSSFSVTYNGFVLSETPTVFGGTLAYSGNATTAVNAENNYTITPEGLTSSNYNISFVSGKLNITKKELTVTATGPSKEYGTALISEINSSNFIAGATGVGTETITGVTLTPDAAGLAATTSAGSAYIVTPSRATGTGGFMESNYSITYVPFNGVISKKALMIAADNQSKNYGAALPVLTVSYIGLVNGDTVPATLPVVSTTAKASSPVAIYPITAKGAADPNYTISYSEGVLTVNKLALTVTAGNESKVYGEADPVFTYSFSPALIGSDVFTGALDRTSGENAGSYAIYLGTLSSGTNYDITYETRDFRIVAKPLTISNPTVVTSKTYDGSIVAKVTAGALEGIISGDENKINVSAVANYNTRNVGREKPIQVVYTLSGTAIENYQRPVDYTVSDGEIVAKQLIIDQTIVTTNKMHDGTTTADVEKVGTLSGVEVDDVSNVTIAAVANYNDANIGTSKTISVVYSLGGSAMDNYIVPANLQISNAKISEFVVLKALLPVAAGCEGTDLELTYTVLNGTPVQYQIIFGETALSAGFQHIGYSNLPSSDNSGVLFIPVPSGTPYGNYEASLQMRNELGVESARSTFQFVVNVSSDYIVPKFDDVLICNNAANRFAAYQWYKNGNEISGATKQYFSDPDELVGAYSLKLKTTDGQEFFTCPKVLNIPITNKVSVSVVPNPLKINQMSKVQITGMNDEELQGAIMTIYNIQGSPVYSTKNVEQTNSLILPDKEGNYVGHITTINGKDYSYRILLVK